MGGEVTLALNVCGFPADLDKQIIERILRGGAETIRAAGGIICGGHTIFDQERKYGLSVMGQVDPRQIMTKSAAKPGDTLILTKPLGVGLITTALKQGQAEPADVAVATNSMKTLNREASRLLVANQVRACSDITGYSLLGHACEMAERSGVALHFSAASVPLLTGADAYARRDLYPGGTHRNRADFGSSIRVLHGVDDNRLMLLLSPETSGGLLAAVSPASLRPLLQACAEAGQPCHLVGEVQAGSGVVLDV